MIRVFCVTPGKLLQTLQKRSFHKTCYLEDKANVLRNFCNGTAILTFLKFGHDKRFGCFYWKTAANTGKLPFCSVCSSFPVKTAKTFIMTNFLKKL